MSKKETIKHRLMKIIILSLYDREPELHPEDATKLALNLIENNKIIKDFTDQVVSKHAVVWMYISGIVSGCALGMILGFLIKLNLI